MQDHPSSKDSKGNGGNSSPQDPDVFRVLLYAPDRRSLAKVIRELDLDIDHQHPSEREDQKEVEIQGFLTQYQIDELKSRGWRLQVEENLSELGRERQKEVGRGDRFEGGKVKPTGLGRKIREEK